MASDSQSLDFHSKAQTRHATFEVYSPAKQQWGRAGPGPPAASFYKGSLDNESAVQEWITLQLARTGGLQMDESPHIST